MSYIFPKNLVAGFNQRGQLLAFITYIDPKKKDMRSGTSWKNWIDHSIALQKWENLPMTGFVINRNVKRDYHYGNNEYVRIWHPLGFEFEISTSTFEHLIGYIDTSKGEILTPCVLGWRDTKVELVSTLDPCFKGVTENPVYSTEDKESIILDFKHGELYDFKGSRVVYMGRGFFTNTTEPYFSYDDCQSDKYPYFFNIDTQEHMQLKTRIKYVRRTDKTMSNEEKMSFSHHAESCFVCTDLDTKQQPIRFAMKNNSQKFELTTTYDKLTGMCYNNSRINHPISELDYVQDGMCVVIMDRSVLKHYMPFSSYQMRVKHDGIWYTIGHDKKIAKTTKAPENWIIAHKTQL